jgi:hypothetical protein
MRKTILILVTFFLALQLHAADSPLAGTWRLTGADEVQPDGTIAEPYGTKPEGLLIVDRDGRYSLQIFRADRAKFASADKRKGTPAEYEAAVQGMSSHIGTIDVDGNLLLFHIEHGSFPNWDGTTQRRRYTLTGDDLAYEIPPSATGNGAISRSRWHRVR